MNLLEVPIDKQIRPKIVALSMFLGLHPISLCTFENYDYFNAVKWAKTSSLEKYPHFTNVFIINAVCFSRVAGFSYKIQNRQTIFVKILEITNR